MIDCSEFDGRRQEICLGYDIYGNPLSMDDRKRAFYIKQWMPELTEQQVIDFIKSQKTKEKITGLGDVVAKAIKVATFGKVSPCNKCRKRQEKLNAMFPIGKKSKVERVELTKNCKRNLLMHIWPTKNGSWKWNCDQIKKRIGLFNGRKIIGIAVGPNTDSADDVKEYMKGYVDEFIVVNNNPRIREGATFPLLLQEIASDDPNEITFYCQAKGAQYPDSFHGGITNIKRWTNAMYKLCLDDIDYVIEDLKTHGITGAFRKFGQFKTPGNNRWHYSGSFYWFRNKDVFERNWRHLDNMFFCVESWPGHMFTKEESGFLHFDNTGDLYSNSYWSSEIKTKLLSMGIDDET